MKFQKLILLIALALNILIVTTKHSCGHENLDFSIVNEQIDNERRMLKEQENSNNNNNRVLPAAFPQQPQPMRVTIDYSLFSTMVKPLTEKQRNYLIKIMENTKVYFQKLLKVIPMEGRNVFRYDKCYEADVPEKYKKDGERNSDIHIFVLYDVEPDWGILANAIHCQMDDNLKRVNYGRVRVNMGRVGINDSDNAFEDDLNTVIHEMLHIFGFSPSLYHKFIDPKTGNYYGDNDNLKEIYKTSTIRGKTTYLLKSKYILETARKYYGCPTLEGMQLENDGAGGSMGAHWEKTIILNEIMTAESSGSEAQLSVFTIALLKDTGFYAQVNENMADDISWGRNRGCEFVLNACKSTTQFPEFINTQLWGQCTIKNDGYGGTSGGGFVDDCQLIGNSVSCNDVSNNDKNNKNVNYEFFGSSSKCIESTANDGSQQIDRIARCHQVQCSPDFQTVTITITQINKQIVCTKNDEGKDIQLQPGQPQFGSISCPDNYYQYCSYTSECPNYCSSKGVCVSGQCLCNEGWTGENCSLSASQCRGFTDNGVCVNSCPRGKYANPDKSCRPTCPKGYYQNGQNCAECNLSCSQCNGPEVNNCLACQYLTYLQDGKCVSQCNPNSIIVSGQCVNTITTCDKDCQRCDSQNRANCAQCKPQMFLNLYSRKCVSNNQCPPGTFADNSNSQCSPCNIAGCKQCDSQTTCAVCDSSQQFFKKGYLCAQCPSQCETCQPDLKTCLTCKLGHYFKDGNCVTNCEENLFQNKDTRKCEPCSLKGCLKCYSLTQCQSCNEQQFYFLDNYICVFNDCKSPCLACRPENKSACTKCKRGLYAHQDKCIQECPRNGYYGDYENSVCVQCPEGCLECPNKDRCYVCDEAKNYFQISGQYQCAKNTCQKPCRSCLDNNKSACTECNTGSYLFKNNCYEKNCPKGSYYQVENNIQICKECPLGCLDCGTKDYCLQCNQSAGYVLDENQICILKLCNSPCQTCPPNNKSSCLSCEYGFLLNQSQCIQSCPRGKYPNYQLGRCDQCMEGCLNCPNNQGCYECDKSYTYRDAKCYKKTNQQYASEPDYPSYPDQPNYPNQPNQPNEPSYPDQPNYPNEPSYPNEPNYPSQPSQPNQPKPTNDGCSAPCKECVRGNNKACISCLPDLFLYQQQCNPYCPRGTYYDMEGYKCNLCNVLLPGCTECGSANVCRECDTRNGYVLNGKNQRGTICIRKRMLLENEEKLEDNSAIQMAFYSVFALINILI